MTVDLRELTGFAGLILLAVGAAVVLHVRYRQWLDIVSARPGDRPKLRRRAFLSLLAGFALVVVSVACFVVAGD